MTDKTNPDDPNSTSECKSTTPYMIAILLLVCYICCLCCSLAGGLFYEFSGAKSSF